VRQCLKYLIFPSKQGLMLLVLPLVAYFDLAGVKGISQCVVELVDLPEGTLSNFLDKSIV
jgi:hypothetical protein